MAQNSFDINISILISSVVCLQVYIEVLEEQNKKETKSAAAKETTFEMNTNTVKMNNDRYRDITFNQMFKVVIKDSKPLEVPKFSVRGKFQ